MLKCRFGEGNGTPLQYSCLENPMDGGAWWAAVHGVANSRIRLSDFPFTFHFHALEKEMATHSSVLAWRIPGMGEPCGLLSMGSHRVVHNWSDLAAAVAKCRLKKKKHRKSPPNRQAENRVDLPSWLLFSCVTHYVALDQRHSARWNPSYKYEIKYPNS